MIAGVLLEYLSEIGCGSWRKLRDAIAVSGAAPSQAPIWVATNLAALGHLELQSDTLDWSINPPALVELPYTGVHRAVLCGARSPGFLVRTCEAIEEVLGSFDADLVTWEGDVVEGFCVEARETTVLPRLAEQLEITYIPDAARRLAAHLPSINALLRAYPEEPVPATNTERLDTRPDSIARHNWFWPSAATTSEPGVYRQQWIERRVYWAHDGASSRRVPKDIALYSQIPSLLSYAPRTLTVRFHRDARPPYLHLRTLVLCSGHLPAQQDDGSLALHDVPADVARAVGRSLAQQGFS